MIFDLDGCCFHSFRFKQIKPMQSAQAFKKRLKKMKQKDSDENAKVMN